MSGAYAPFFFCHTLFLTALRYGPAGVAGWAIKSVARRPLKMLLAVALEPLLSRAANKLAQRYKR